MVKGLVVLTLVASLGAGASMLGWSHVGIHGKVHAGSTVGVRDTSHARAAVAGTEQTGVRTPGIAAVRVAPSTVAGDTDDDVDVAGSATGSGSVITTGHQGFSQAMHAVIHTTMTSSAGAAAETSHTASGAMVSTRSSLSGSMANTPSLPSVSNIKARTSVAAEPAMSITTPILHLTTHTRAVAKIAANLGL